MKTKYKINGKQSFVKWLPIFTIISPLIPHLFSYIPQIVEWASNVCELICWKNKSMAQSSLEFIVSKLSFIL
jgi:hypothetical protein